MGKPYSMDLRERVAAAVDPGGLSCHRERRRNLVGVEHGHSLGSAIPRDRQHRADGWAQAEEDFGEAP